MKFIIAIEFKDRTFHKFRVFDSDYYRFIDVSMETLLRDLENGMQIENAKLVYESTHPFRIFIDFRAKGCDSSRLARLNENGRVKLNNDGALVIRYEGEYVHLVNGYGEYCKVHMLQVANSVKNKKIALANAVIESNGWIRPFRLDEL